MSSEKTGYGEDSVSAVMHTLGLHTVYVEGDFICEIVKNLAPQNTRKLIYCENFNLHGIETTN